jgi:hypothetical protein
MFGDVLILLMGLDMLLWWFYKIKFVCDNIFFRYILKFAAN